MNESAAREIIQTTPRRELAASICRTRKIVGLTQAELAKRVGIERSTLAHFEKAKTDLGASTFATLNNELQLALKEKQEDIAKPRTGYLAAVDRLGRGEMPPESKTERLFSQVFYELGKICGTVAIPEAVLNPLEEKLKQYDAAWRSEAQELRDTIAEQSQSLTAASDLLDRGKELLESQAKKIEEQKQLISKLRPAKPRKKKKS